MGDADYRSDTGPRGALLPRPYDAMRTGLTSPVLSRGVSLAAQWAGGKIFDTIAGTRARRHACIHACVCACACACG